MKLLTTSALLLTLSTHLALAQEHRVEVIEEAAKAEGLTKEMTSQFADQGVRVIRGSSRTVCEIWPCKQWETIEGFKPTVQRLYPFKPGQLIGLLHFSRRGKDFRDQTIDRGWYTLRYGLQPVDGNHVGTSPTLDFLLLVKAEDDESPNLMKGEQLIEASAAAAQSSHPAMLCLQPSPSDVPKKPTMSHQEEKDWWVLQFVGHAGVAGKLKPLPVNLIVVGQADE